MLYTKTSPLKTMGKKLFKVQDSMWFYDVAFSQIILLDAGQIITIDLLSKNMDISYQSYDSSVIGLHKNHLCNEGVKNQTFLLSSYDRSYKILLYNYNIYVSSEDNQGLWHY